MDDGTDEGLPRTFVCGRRHIAPSVEICTGRPKWTPCSLMTEFQVATPRLLNWGADVLWRRPPSPAEAAVVLAWRSAGPLSNRHSAEFEISLRQALHDATSAAW